MNPSLDSGDSRVTQRSYGAAMTTEVRLSGPVRPQSGQDPAFAWVFAEDWAVDVAVTIVEIRNEAKLAAATPLPGTTPATTAATAAAIEDLLINAEQAIRRRRRRQPRGPADRWRGASVDLAYRSVHAAEVFLVDLLDDAHLEAIVPAVAARVQSVLDPMDPQRLAIDDLCRRAAMPPPTGGNPVMSADDRAAIKEAMRIGYEAVDKVHVRIRSFRNLLISAAVLIIILMALLVGLVALRPTAMPMCFKGQNVVGGRVDEMFNVCPSGEHHPSGGDVLIVAGLGLLGGALAAAFSIRNVRGTSTPYDVPIALALLKPPLGALSAVAGIVLIGGAFIPGLSQLDTQPQILAYSLLFGYAQQLISRLIDNQAHNILNSVPSKDSDGKKPVPPTQMPPPKQGG